MKVKKTHYAVLGMLAIEPMSGYEIRKLMRESTAYFWSESDGQLYPALAELEKLAFINSQAKTTPTSLREKKTYCITTKGKKALEQWLVQEPDKNSVRSEFLLKIFLSANTSPEIALEHMANCRRETKIKLHQLIEYKKVLKQEAKGSAHLIYWLACLDYGIQMTETKLKWCDTTLKQLKGIA